MNDLNNICLSCGLCCDGSLIGHVQLDQKEVSRLQSILELEDDGSNGFFLQPCSKFCGKCTIYDQRPKACDNFDCELLKSVQANEVTYEEALQLIAEVKQLKAGIEIKLGQEKLQLQSPSFYYKMVELKKILKKNNIAPELTKIQFELIEDLAKLDKLLLKSFGLTMD